ncbi:MAG TPA: hypothetical protein PKI15_08175 [Candidatus Cloacimonadota bacterium]|nr:hypothetical protein [Candidatus Cloacimonadota bacterium]
MIVTISDLYDEIPAGCTYEAARRAYENISFSPEKRAESEVSDTRDDIKHLFDAMALHITEENKDEAFASFRKYVESYRSKYSAYLHAKSNCVSWMITGRSGLNVAKCNKANDREERLHKLFVEWRSKAFQSMCKRIFGSYSMSGVILSDDPDAIILLQSKLERLKSKQLMMKESNKVFRTFDKTKTLSEFFDHMGITNHKEKEEIKINIGWYQCPYPPYRLTNNNSTIKSTAERIDILQRYAQKESSEEVVNGVTVVHNTDLVRLQLFFPGKPDALTIKNLKSKGFHWSPSQGAWQRQDTTAAAYAARQVLAQYSENH